MALCAIAYVQTTAEHSFPELQPHSGVVRFGNILLIYSNWQPSLLSQELGSLISRLAIYQCCQYSFLRSWNSSCSQNKLIQKHSTGKWENKRIIIILIIIMMHPVRCRFHTRLSRYVSTIWCNPVQQSCSKLYIFLYIISLQLKRAKSHFYAYKRTKN